MLLLFIKSLRGLSPEYLSDTLSRYVPSRSLRSSGRNRIQGEAVISVYGSHLCLPEDLNTSSPSVDIFKQKLKTYLFSFSFYGRGFFLFNFLLLYIYLLIIFLIIVITDCSIVISFTWFLLNVPLVLILITVKHLLCSGTKGAM